MVWVPILFPELLVAVSMFTCKNALRHSLLQSFSYWTVLDSFYSLASIFWQCSEIYVRTVSEQYSLSRVGSDSFQSVFPRQYLPFKYSLTLGHFWSGFWFRIALCSWMCQPCLISGKFRWCSRWFSNFHLLSILFIEPLFLIGNVLIIALHALNSP